MTALPTPERALEPRLRGMAPSPSLAIQELCAKLAATGRPVFQLGLGQSPFPVPRSVVYSLRANAAEKSYLPVRGLPQLRAAVADYHRRRHGVLHTSDDVLVGPGSKELMFLLQVAFRGELMLPVPSCVSYEPQGRLVGHRVRRIPTDMAKRFLLTPDALDEACQTSPDVPRLLVLNSPSNPAGQRYTMSHLEALASVARRHGVIVLSDEIYAELDFRGAHVSIARFYEEGTIIASGLSPERLFLRLALVDFDGARALMSAFGSPLDEAFLRTYCAPTMRAMDALVEWITGL